MKKKVKKTLQAAVLLSCATLFPWQAMAAEVEEAEEVEYDVYEETFTYGGNTYFKAEIVDVGQKTENGTTREIEDEEFDAIQEQAIAYLGDITGAPVKAYPIISLTPLDIKDANASAESEVYKNGLTQYASYFIGAGIKKNNGEAAADVTVNLAPEGTSWYMEKYPILPVNGIDADYAGTIVHEMVHAMGVGCFNMGEDEEDATKKCLIFEKTLRYTDGLYDAFGRNAKEMFSGMTFEDDDERVVSIEPITKDEYQQYKDGLKEIEDDTFYIIKDSDKVGPYGGVYFSGENVSEVLNGAEIAWANGTDLPTVNGIPIECYEGEDENLDLSHLELQNGLMSHQNYRNWCTLMEAELAVLQDIGFTIDRSKFFGKSIYASGITDSINIDWSSDTDRAIGLHIYGSNNDVTLADGSDIAADGSYSMGVRVDGVGNTLTINDVSVAVGDNDDDCDNYGISVNYGKDHNVTISDDASVVAKGEGGIGAVFDFGSNELGDRAEYRGSYIRGEYDDEQGEFTNIDFTEDGALEGALVNEFTVHGKLEGEKAIYISPNSLVNNINIGDNAEIQGDIISEWNPEGVEYFYTRTYDGENPYKGLKPDLPENADLDDYRTNLNFDGDRTFTDNIIGPYGLIMNVNDGKLTTENKSDGRLTSVAVNGVNIADKATYKLNNTLTVGSGYGKIIVDGEMILRQDGSIITGFNNEKRSDLPEYKDYNQSTTIINDKGKLHLSDGSLVLDPEKDYYNNDVKIKILSSSNADTNTNFGKLIVLDVDGNFYEKTKDNDKTNDVYVVSPTLEMTAVQKDVTKRADDNSVVTIGINRTLENIVLNEAQGELGDVYVNGSNKLVEANDDWENVYEAIDFSAMDGSGVRQAFDQMLPSAYGYGAMATMDLHRMLSDFAVGGSLSAATNDKEKGKWHNIIIPYASETDHIKNGTGYKNNHTGMVGAMERTLDDVTVGWHAALNHQSTNGAENGHLKGDGLYVGAQVKYAPKEWNGWSTFGIARVGIENMEMQRNFNFNGYNGNVERDFTAFSGNLRAGGAYEKEAKGTTFGPFAALDYAFAHHPSIKENGEGAGRLRVDGGTYDSLRTQLGYRVQTVPKRLKNKTYWQANAAVAWNHELLDDAGNVSASFRDFGGHAFGCSVDNYGRDSFGLMAGVTFKNPNKLDITVNLGTDIYRHGGNTLYAKCAFEWKF